MKLNELLRFEEIVIQCHDNPDADAIASGWGLLRYFTSHGKQARLIYGGKLPIQKSSLVLMVERLGIPICHVQTLERPPELLLTADCQYGERNVQNFAGQTVAVIDHHKAREEALPPLSEVRDNHGSCSTIVWDMLVEEGFPVEEDEALSTALYYGLFMDTGKFQELRHPKDKDLQNALEFHCNKHDLFQLQNCNLSLEELGIAGRAFGNYDYCPDYRYAVAEVERCDPNLLGVISDTLMEVDVVNACIAFCMLDNGAKLSVRSCVRETRADELAAYVSAGLGSGGGHPRKSGGFLQEALLAPACEARFGPLGDAPLCGSVRKLLMARLGEYFQEQEDVIYSGSGSVPDLSGERAYRKRRIPIGYVRGTDLYPAGTEVTLRMLELEKEVTHFVIREDTYFIIGVEAEVYVNDEDYFLSHNDLSDELYCFQGEYAPTVHQAVQAADSRQPRQKSIVEFARTCVPKEGPRVRAREITRRTKVFVPWSETYLLGEPGDWLVAREENPSDVYIVKRDIFAKSYQPCP